MAKKNPVYIPRPGQSAPGFRLHPTSKHRKGRAAKAYQGKVEYGNGRTGAFGGATPSPRVKKPFRAKLLAKSADIRSKLSDREMEAEFANWRRRMSPKDRAKARELGFRVTHQSPENYGKPAGNQPDVEFHDPADLPEASLTDHPIDRLEPQSPFAVAIASFGSAEITAAADCFADSLTWALDVPDHRNLVLLGERALVAIAKLRLDLIGEIPKPLAVRWWHMMTDFAGRVQSTHRDLATVGEFFGRLLEWIRRGDRLSTIGERLMLVAYVVRPAMIDSPTLEALGEVNNKTRQAKDKLVQCLRDTFAGLKAVAMRGEITRTKCQLAHAS